MLKSTRGVFKGEKIESIKIETLLIGIACATNSLVPFHWTSISGSQNRINSYMYTTVMEFLCLFELRNRIEGLKKKSCKWLRYYHRVGEDPSPSQKCGDVINTAISRAKNSGVGAAQWQDACLAYTRLQAQPSARKRETWKHNSELLSPTPPTPN